MFALNVIVMENGRFILIKNEIKGKKGIKLRKIYSIIFFTNSLNSATFIGFAT